MIEAADNSSEELESSGELGRFFGWNPGNVSLSEDLRGVGRISEMHISRVNMPLEKNQG